MQEITGTLPEGVQVMAELDKFLAFSNLEAGLLDLVKIRASQINGCPYSLKLYWSMATIAKEKTQRLEQLDHWQQADCFNAKERAALAWIEALTHQAPSQVNVQLHRQLSGYFSDEEIVNLTLAINSINSWHRINLLYAFQANRVKNAS